MITRYSDSLKLRWDELHGKMYNSTFMSKRDFVEYHKDRFVDHSILIESDKMNALFPANEKDGVVYSHGGLSYGGLLIERRTKLPVVLKMFGELVDYYQSLGFKKIIYKQTPIIYCDYYQGSENYALQLLNATIIRRDSNVVVDSGNGLGGLSDRKKRNIRKATKSGLTFANDFSDCKYEEYWNNILNPCLNDKHGVKPTHSLEEMLRLKRLFPDNIFLSGVYLNAAMIGGAVFLKDKRVLHSQYIASTDKCIEYNGLDLLFYSILDQWGFDDILSFGVCNEDQGKVLNVGLSNWKQEYGAEIVNHDYYEIDLNQDFKDLKRNLTNV